MVIYVGRPAKPAADGLWCISRLRFHFNTNSPGKEIFYYWTDTLAPPLRLLKNNGSRLFFVAVETEKDRRRKRSGRSDWRRTTRAAIKRTETETWDEEEEDDEDAEQLGSTLDSLDFDDPCLHGGQSISSVQVRRSHSISLSYPSRHVHSFGRSREKLLVKPKLITRRRDKPVLLPDVGQAATEEPRNGGRRAKRWPAGSSSTNAGADSLSHSDVFRTTRRKFIWDTRSNRTAMSSSASWVRSLLPLSLPLINDCPINSRMVVAGSDGYIEFGYNACVGTDGRTYQKGETWTDAKVRLEEKVANRSGGEG